MSKKKKPETPKEEKEKTYSYKAFTTRGLKKRTFKESEMTERDFLHFYKNLADAYNLAPFGVKLAFIQQASPKMQEHLEKDSTQAAIKAGIMMDDSSDMKIVN